MQSPPVVPVAPVAPPPPPSWQPPPKTQLSSQPEVQPQEDEHFISHAQAEAEEEAEEEAVEGTAEHCHVGPACETTKGAAVAPSTFTPAIEPASGKLARNSDPQLGPCVFHSADPPSAHL